MLNIKVFMIVRKNVIISIKFYIQGFIVSSDL